MSVYEFLDVNETVMGKKSFGIALAAENSIAPVLLLASTIGKDHTS